MSIFLGKYSLGENNYYNNRRIKIENDKIKCQKFFERILSYLKIIFKIEGFISFNFRYHREIEFQKATIAKSLKFLALPQRIVVNKIRYR